MSTPYSFRDPSGSLEVKEEIALRSVKPAYSAETLAFLRSPIADKLGSRGDLIDTEVLEEGKQGAHLLLGHPRVFFPSYPWEWTPSQLAAAADLTLDLCQDLIEAGWILKDATPSNVLLEGTRPVFVDILSIQRRDPEEALWIAYSQFVRTFLLPLAANRSLGWPLSAMISRRDGYEPDDLFAELGMIQRMGSPLRLLVTLPVLIGGQGTGSQHKSMRRPPYLAQDVLGHSVRSLRRSLRKLTRRHRKSRWSTYEETAAHYSAGDKDRKITFVQECLSLAGPRHVLDIGANVGVFSRIAAASGARVVAWDADVEATERAWLDARAEGADVLPLVADFARPTPATGWNNGETMSLLDRSRGRFDMVMMLAVLHHVLVHDQIPLELVAKLTRELTRSWLLVEWVGPEDGKFRSLSRGRDSLYRELTEAAFLAAFGRYFVPVRRAVLENGRSLHLLRVI